MILFKSKRLRKFHNEILQICNENSYEISGDYIEGYKIKTPLKTYNVTIMSSYPFKNSGVVFASDKMAYLWSKIVLLKGLGGMISFPLNKTVELHGFDKEAEGVENICVVYPKCLMVEIIRIENKDTRWHPGDTVGNISVFDGASFKDELKNPGLYTGEREIKHSAVVGAVGL